MWYYRNMPVKMITPRPHIFKNIDEVSNKLCISKYLIHKSIVNNFPLRGGNVLVYIVKASSSKPRHVKGYDQRRISRTIIGKKRPRCETDDSSNNV
jgi:hypothetical protein